MDFIDEIYYTLLGELLPECAVAGVENAFSEGSVCCRAMETFDCAKAQLLARLGNAEEDADLEAMLDSLLTVQHILYWKMFLYGESGKVPEE